MRNFRSILFNVKQRKQLSVDAENILLSDLGYDVRDFIRIKNRILSKQIGGIHEFTIITPTNEDFRDKVFRVDILSYTGQLYCYTIKK